MANPSQTTGRLRRSRWLALIAAAALVVAACGDGDDEDAEPAATEAATAAADEAPAEDAGCAPGETDGDLAFYNWADYMDEELLLAFEEETGISVDYSVYESNEQMLTQVESGAAIYDLVVPSD